MIKFITYPFLFLLYPIFVTLFEMGIWLLTFIGYVLWDITNIKNNYESWSGFSREDIIEYTKSDKKVSPNIDYDGDIDYTTTMVYEDKTPFHSVIRRTKKMNSWYIKSKTC